ncbi:MAG: acyltransferase [Muribaculaceae bacterium]|nr:acyltransferase [Muribaculaceae bacterium]
MDILILLLLLLTLYGAKVSVAGHDDYISRGQTDAIKGIFAIIILFSHMRGYLPEPGSHDRIYYGVLDGIGQLMVVMFMLYSGYGVMESLKRDRRKYVSTFLTHRLLKVWIMFAIAVGLFFLLDLALGMNYEPRQYFWCWVGWESIGNSNWFVFDILVLYLLTYFVLIVADRLGLDLKPCAIGVFIAVILFDLFLRSAGKESYWYDTIVAYPVGMLYSLYKRQIEAQVRGWRWAVWFIASAGLLALILYISRSELLQSSGALKMVNHLLFISSSSFFAVALVLLTMKLKLDNKALRWLGVNAFAIYVLQRLSMIICTRFELNKNALVFSAIVIPSTLLIAAIFTAATNRLNSFLIKK